jgi:hypothetical protein
MNVGYLLVDKVFDVWHEGIAYDTALPQAGGRWATERVFHADSVPRVGEVCYRVMRVARPRERERGPVSAGANAL